MSYTALYARVSTQNQGTGLEAQVRALEAYCQANGINEYKVFADEGISGAKESRPSLNAMLEAVEKGEVSTVVVYSFSRFARSTKHLLKALEEFNAKTVGFVSLSEKLDTSTATGRAVFTIIAAVSQLERELVSERVKNGLKNARAKGAVLGRKKIFSNSELFQTLKLSDQNLSYREIGKLIGCSAATVCRELKRVS